MVEEGPTEQNYDVSMNRRHSSTSVARVVSQVNLHHGSLCLIVGHNDIPVCVCVRDIHKLLDEHLLFIDPP